jgi:hypothetical protein
MKGIFMEILLLADSCAILGTLRASGAHRESGLAPDSAAEGPSAFMFRPRL